MLSFIIGTRDLELKRQRNIDAIRSIQHCSCLASSISGKTIEVNASFAILNMATLLTRQVIMRSLTHQRVTELTNPK